MQTRMIQCMNQWFLSLQKGIKLKLSNIGITDWTNMAYNLLTGCLNAFTNLFFLLGFSSGLFSIKSSSKSKLDRKYDSKESHNINALTKDFSRLNHLVET